MTVDVPSLSSNRSQLTVIAPVANVPASPSDRVKILPAPVHSCSPNPATTMEQMVLQLQNPVFPLEMPGESIVPLLEPMQRLIAVIQRLRSPDSGWSPDLPQTPATLAPYISEEVEDVIQVLRHLPEELIAAPLSGHPSTIPACLRQPGYVLVKELTPWILWAIARSGYAIMQVLEGIPAQLLTTERDWQGGMLRLTVTLTIQTAAENWELELVTHTFSPSMLSLKTRIQTVDNPLCREDSSVQEVLQRIEQQVRATTPALHNLLSGQLLSGQLLSGQAVNVLPPGQAWQTGWLRLHLGFVFVAEAEPTAKPHVQPVPEPAPLPQRLQLRFTDPDQLQAYQARVTRHQLTHCLQSLLPPQVFTSPVSSEALATSMIQTAFTISDWLQHPLSLAQQGFLQKVWRFDELRSWLLWMVTRSTPQLMDWMGGMPVTLLAPGREWDTGMLRLVIRLDLLTPMSTECIDLVTGQPFQPVSLPLSTAAIAQVSTITGCLAPQSIQDISNSIQASLYQLAPEVLLFASGLEIDLTGRAAMNREEESDRQWEPGGLQLTIGLEFVGAKSSPHGYLAIPLQMA